MSRGDSPDDAVLRFGNEGEKSLMVYWGPIFAEYEGCRGAGDSHLVRVYWIFLETS